MYVLNLNFDNAYINHSIFQLATLFKKLISNAYVVSMNW